MDAVSYAHSAKQAKRIKRFIENPDSNSGVLTQPKVIEAGETVTIKSGRQAILTDTVVNGDLVIEAGADVSMLASVVPKSLEDIIYTLDSSIVKLMGNQTIEDVKTFTSSPIVPTPTTNFQVATKKYVDDAIVGGTGTGGGSGLSIEDKAKLDGIEVGATKNKTDGFLLSRSNHTGSIPISVVENLEQELAKIVAITNKLDAKGVEANKVLVSNGDDTSEWKDYNTYSYTESEIAPLNPKLGDDWRDTTSGKLYKWSSVGGVAEWSEIGAGSSSGVFNPDNDIMLSAGKGVVMTSGNGTIYKLYIDNDGRLTTEVI